MLLILIILLKGCEHITFAAGYYPEGTDLPLNNWNLVLNCYHIFTIWIPLVVLSAESIRGGSQNMQTISWLAWEDPAATDKRGWVWEVSGRVCKSLSWESRTIVNHHFWRSFDFAQERESVEIAMTTGCQSSLNGVHGKQRVIPKSAVGHAE